MGGGKTKTYTGVGGGEIFDGDNNLMVKDLIRSISGTGYFPIENIKQLIQSSQWMWNVKYLEKKGYAVAVQAQSDAVTFSGILSYINKNLDPDAEVVISYPATNDAIPRIDAYLKASYVNTRRDVYDFELAESITSADGVTRLVTETYPMNIYRINGVERRSAFKTVTTSGYSYKVPELSGAVLTLSDPGTTNTNTSTVTLPPDTSVYYKVSWGINTPQGVEPTGIAYIDADSITKEKELFKLFEFPMKKSSAWQIDTKDEVLFMKKFGFKEDSFDSVKSDAKAVDFFLTYATSLDKTKYTDELNKVYGAPSSRQKVVIKDSRYGIVYTPSSGGHSININGVSDYIASDMQLYMLPIDIQVLNLKDRYQHLDDLFAYMGTATDTVEIKWYQTPAFQFVMFVIALIIAAYVSPIAAGLVMLGWAAGQIIPRLSPEMQEKFKWLMVILAVIQIVTGDWLSVYGVIGNILAFTSLISSVWFEYEMEKIAEEISKEHELTNEADKKIKEMTNKVVYNPFASYESYYNTIFDLPGIYYSEANSRKSSFDDGMYEPFRT